MRRTNFGKTPLLIAGGAAVGALAIGGAGLAIASDDGPGDRDSGTNSSADASGTGGGNGGNGGNGGSSGSGGTAGTAPKIDLLKAAGIATDEVKGGVVHDIELDNGFWEVDLVVADGKREHDLRVDADSGKVSDQRDHRADAEELQITDAKVTLAEAVGSAEKKLGEGKVTDAQFEGVDRDDDRDDRYDDDRDDRDDRDDKVAHWSLEAQGNGSGDDDRDDRDDDRDDDGYDDRDGDDNGGDSNEVAVNASNGKTMKAEYDD